MSGKGALLSALTLADGQGVWKARAACSCCALHALLGLTFRWGEETSCHLEVEEQSCRGLRLSSAWVSSGCFGKPYEGVAQAGFDIHSSPFPPSLCSGKGEDSLGGPLGRERQQKSTGGRISGGQNN